MDTVSIITVTYNAAATLEETILSVAGQDYPAIEFIVIDGKSTDGTIDIIKKYESGISYWTSAKDNGIYDAMNKGIAAAKGDWLLFLGADDTLFEPTILSKVFLENDISGADYIYGDIMIKSDKRIFGGSRTFEELIDKPVGSHQAVFYGKQVFEKFGLYNLRYKVLADYDMNLKVFDNDAFNKLYLPLTISIFNDVGGESSTAIDYNFFSDKVDFFINEKKMRPRDPLLQQYYFYKGIAEIFKGDLSLGFSDCFKAFTGGRRKIYFMLVFVKFMSGKLGLGKKIKIV